MTVENKQMNEKIPPLSKTMLEVWAFQILSGHCLLQTPVVLFELNIRLYLLLQQGTLDHGLR